MTRAIRVTNFAKVTLSSRLMVGSSSSPSRVNAQDPPSTTTTAATSSLATVHQRYSVADTGLLTSGTASLTPSTRSRRSSTQPTASAASSPSTSICTDQEYLGIYPSGSGGLA